MRERIRLVLILILIMLIAGLTVKRSIGMADSGKEAGLSGESTLQGTTVGSNNTVDNKTGDGTEMSDELRDCQDSVVTIQCECGSGNAVFLCEKEDSYVLCTAAHVLQGLAGLNAEETQIEISETSAVVKGIWISNTYDVAFVEIAKNGKDKAGTSDGSEFDILKGNNETGLSDVGYMNLKEDDMLLVWSYYGGECVSTKIKVNSPWIYVEDFGYHMIWGAATDAKGGMSGSGVFDSDGHLAGILCGGNDTEVAVLPVNIILGELKNSSIDISFD